MMGGPRPIKPFLVPHWAALGASEGAAIALAIEAQKLISYCMERAEGVVTAR
jgi:hypothetical protein